MKSIYLYVVALLIVVSTSCSKTPMFPDPGIDDRMDLRDTVRRDTIDTYILEMNITAPNGVKIIQVLNGHNYDLVEDISDDYSGQTDFKLRYKIDLTHIDSEDEKFTYIIKVVDNENRSFNRGFSLVVKKRSEPTVIFNGNQDQIGVVTRVFDLQGTFETGLYNITTYSFLFDGVEIDGAKGDLTSLNVNAYKFKIPCNLNLVEDKEHIISVILSDNKGNTTTTNIGVRFAEMQRPYLVIATSNNTTVYSHYYMTYKEDGSLDEIKWKSWVNNVEQNPHTFKFIYDDDYKLIEYTCSYYMPHLAAYELMTYTITYNEQGLLYEVYQDDPFWGERAKKTAKEYNADGSVKSFYYGPVINNKVIDNVTYFDDPATGEPLLLEYWHNFNSSTWRMYSPLESVTPAIIPTYQPKLPFVYAESMMTPIFKDLFMYKYVATEVIREHNGDVGYTRTYTQDDKGQLMELKIDAVTGRGAFSKYQFIYK